MTVTITTYDEAREAYRSPYLRQALYDEGEVIMADVLVNLHGDEHAARRRLENRSFRRDAFDLYETAGLPRDDRADHRPLPRRGRRRPGARSGTS